MWTSDQLIRVSRLIFFAEKQVFGDNMIIELDTNDKEIDLLQN